MIYSKEFTISRLLKIRHITLQEAGLILTMIMIMIYLQVQHFIEIQAHRTALPGNWKHIIITI